MVSAAALTKVNRYHPVLYKVWKLWAEITTSAFETGKHDLINELAAFEALTGICPTKKDSKLNKIYPLILLSAADFKLPYEIEKSYLEWIWNYSEGIYYLTWFNMGICPDIISKEFPFWLRALDIISDYSYGRILIKNSVDYIWNLRDKDGLWDFGANTKSANYAKAHCGWQLADSWREPSNRKTDCTIRILLFLKKYSESG